MNYPFNTISFLAIAIFCQPLAGQPSWRIQSSPVSTDLISVSFSDTAYGWAVSKEGSILHTVNGGENWELLPGPEGFYPNKICFQNRDTGWMAGSYTTHIDTAFILKTDDGGISWQRNHHRIGAKINDLFFVNENIGIAVGFEGDTLGLRMRTNNGGQDWLNMTGINIISEFYSVHFRDSTKGVICGSGPTLLHTTNGGMELPGWALNIYNFEVEMFDIVSVGASYGCMVGAGGKLWFTKDDWSNSMDYDYSEGDTLRAVDALEPLAFYAVGDAGTILVIGYNQFLGLAVQDQSLDISGDLLDIDAVDDAHIWAVGENGTIVFFGFDNNPSSGNWDHMNAETAFYPNPAKDFIVIQHDHALDRVLHLYNLQGSLLRTFHVDPHSTSQRLELDHLAPGIYLMDTGTGIRKIIITDR